MHINPCLSFDDDCRETFTFCHRCLGSVMMALEKIFRAKRFGVLTHRFGVSWTINCEKEKA